MVMTGWAVVRKFNGRHVSIKPFNLEFIFQLARDQHLAIQSVRLTDLRWHIAVDFRGWGRGLPSGKTSKIPPPISTEILRGHPSKSR